MKRYNGIPRVDCDHLVLIYSLGRCGGSTRSVFACKSSIEIVAKVMQGIQLFSGSEGHTFTREIQRRDGTILNITQHEVGDEGCVVWDAALVLTYYLESGDFTDDAGNSLLAGRTVVELGSGTGVVGIQAAACGANCVVTDLEEVVSLMQTNIDNNQHQLKGSICAKTLQWGDSIRWNHTPPDYVLMADCIYYEASVEPLFKTVCELSDTHTVVLCCYEEREMGNKPEILKRFMQLFEKHFHMEEVTLERQDPEYRSDDIHIIRMMRKS